MFRTLFYFLQTDQAMNITIKTIPNIHLIYGKVLINISSYLHFIHISLIKRSFHYTVNNKILMNDPKLLGFW